MYLILMAGHKDIAKVWREGDVIKVQAFDPSLQDQIERIVYDAEKRLRKDDEYFETQAKRQGKKLPRPKVEFIERLGHFLAPVFTVVSPFVESEKIWVDCVDEKTGERWDINLGIIKDEKSQGPRRAK